ncbi:MAG: hypothetical protein PHP92_03360 [Candidatus Nanoarchaeia archaeon]|nr:hypothetical protein [Candidatus Nanoarchaeia archaeon]
MKRLISYCSGGIANRIRPISCYQQLAEKSGRELFIFWEKSYRCEAHLNDLFENNFKYITREEMLNLNSYTIYCGRSDSKHVYEAFGESLLNDLIKIHGTSSIGAHTMDLTDQKENVVIISNGYLTNTDMNITKQFIRNLKPIKEIQDKINILTQQLNISTEVIGVQARGTDFNVHIGEYDYSFQEGLKRNPKVKFLVCSDDISFENYFVNKYPNNVIVRAKEYAQKNNPNKNSWFDNTRITKQAAQDAIVDMYLLAKTNFLIYPKNSSFAEIIKIIQGN